MRTSADSEACGERSREAVRQLIELQRRQLEALREDGQQRLDELSAAFEVLVASVQRDAPARGVSDERLRESTAAAVRTIQFADCQAQRLEHLIRALEQMASLLGSPGHLDEAAWQALRTGLRACYTMEREVEVFDRLFAGEDPVGPPATGTAVSSTGADVELF